MRWLPRRGSRPDGTKVDGESTSVTADGDEPVRSRRAHGATSIRMPWAVGLMLYAILAVVIPVVAFPESRRASELPDAVVRQQDDVTENSAQSIRRSVNEGVVDLQELAQFFEVLGQPPEHIMRQATSEFASLHERYESVYIIDIERRVLSRDGGEPRSDLLRGDRPFQKADMDDATFVGGGDVIIPQYAPMQRCPAPGPGTPLAECTDVVAIVGHYRREYLLNGLGGLELGLAWLVNREGRILAAPANVDLGRPLPEPELRRAAARARDGESAAFVHHRSDGAREVIAYAPVAGHGPAGDLGWAVITARGVDEFAGGGSAAWVGLLLGLGVALVTLFVFGWWWAGYIRPLDALEEEADRIAEGDLRQPVRLHRHDEIGLVARDLEHIRIKLLGSTNGAAGRLEANGSSTTTRARAAVGRTWARRPWRDGSNRGH